MESKLNHLSILKLINLYRSHPILWDMSTKLYRRNDLKAKSYEEIAKEMGMPVEATKKKIRSLRTTYTAEKRKMNHKKSGSGVEENYISSLSWFGEMSVLDSSIVTRKSMDNSAEETLENWIEVDEAHFEDSTRSKPIAGQKIDKAIEKILEGNENEFTLFGASIAHQLQSLPIEVGYELMREIQILVTNRKIRNVRENRFNPLALYSEPSSNTSRIYNSTPSDLINIALTEAQIEFDEDDF